MITPMFAIGLPHGMDWVWLLLIVLLFFGGSKLPGLAKGLGRSIAEFKKAKDDVEREFNKALHDDPGKKQDKPELITYTDGDNTAAGSEVKKS